MRPDIIGKIVAKHATYDENDDEVVAATYVDGWHVNLLTEEPEWLEYLCDPQPANPRRVYAGCTAPVAYRFPDEETFRQVEPTQESII
jgi:hypothetical protein